MSDVETPEGWTEEEWRDYFESATAVSERDGEESGMSPVDVPEIREDAT
jgi:hypothetical protein